MMQASAVRTVRNNSLIRPNNANEEDFQEKSSVPSLYLPFSKINKLQSYDLEPAKTPDNKDVPKRKLSYTGWSNSEYTSFQQLQLQFSDSLDNNCLLNDETSEFNSGNSLDLDKLEEETVARLRKNLFCPHVHVEAKKMELECVEVDKSIDIHEDLSSQTLLSVSSTEFQDTSEVFVNKYKGKTYTGYYSDYFHVHNKRVQTDTRFVELGLKMFEVSSNESHRKLVKLAARSATVPNLLKNSFQRKKAVSRLIEYFETGREHEKREEEICRNGESNVTQNIFDEVSAVRERDLMRDKNSKKPIVIASQKKSTLENREEAQKLFQPASSTVYQNEDNMRVENVTNQGQLLKLDLPGLQNHSRDYAVHIISPDTTFELDANCAPSSVGSSESNKLTPTSSALTIITPPIEFRNCFPASLSTIASNEPQDGSSLKNFEDADVFSNVSVKNILNVLNSPGLSEVLFQEMPPFTWTQLSLQPHSNIPYPSRILVFSRYVPILKYSQLLVSFVLNSITYYCSFFVTCVILCAIVSLDIVYCYEAL